MERSLKDLSDYRIECAQTMLEDAEAALRASSFKTSLNRSYYAIFHAIRAVNALDGFDSKKHSGVISYFNLHSVKTGKFEKRFSETIKDCYRLRERSDYEDFYIASKEDAEQQLAGAKEFVAAVKDYLKAEGY